jgi:dolichol kinase
MSEGEKLNEAHFVDDNEMVGSNKWGDSLKDALPYIRSTLVFFAFIVLSINVFAWSYLKTPDRWAWVLMTIVLLFVANEKGKRGNNFQFLIYWAIGLITAFWI